MLSGWVPIQLIKLAIMEISAQYFWHEEGGEGRLCYNCHDEIYRQSFVPVMQMGETIELRFKDLDFRLCQPCYDKLPPDKR